MGISESDLQRLQVLDEARARHKELAALLDFYRDLYQVQYEAKADLPGPETRDEGAMRWRLEGGIPQLTFDQLALEPDPFFRLAQRVAAVVGDHNPGLQIQWEEWPPEKLAAQAREIFEFWETLTAPSSRSQEVGVSPPVEAGGGSTAAVHPAALVAGLSLAPYLQHAGEVILRRLDLTLWHQEYCPVCGGRPNLALLEEERGARVLVCSRCNSTWPYTRVTCPFCKSQNKQTYYLSDDGVYRLYVCPDCHRYLKTVDLREVHRPVYPEIERLLTVGMDLAARQEGYED